MPEEKMGTCEVTIQSVRSYDKYEVDRQPDRNGQKT